MNIVELNEKAGKFNQFKAKAKNWIKAHKDALIFGAITGIGIGGTIAMCKYIDNMPVTVDDITEVTKLPIPSTLNEITMFKMYDDRLDCWIPVIRKLEEDEFEEIYKELAENPEKTLLNCLFERELIMF